MTTRPLVLIAAIVCGGVSAVAQLTTAPRNLRILLADTPPAPAPPTGTTYYSTNFSSGTAAPLSVYAYGGGACGASTDYADPGSARSLKCTVPPGTGAAALEAWFGRAGSGLAALTRDPTLDQDLYQQIRFVIGAGTTAAAGGQFKTHKSVYGQVGSNINGWVMTSFSPGSGEGLITEPELWTNSFNPNASFTTALYPHFSEGVVYDVIYYYRRNSALNCGVAAMWVNGSRRFQTACVPFLGPGGGLSSAGLVLWDGATYLQDGTGTFTVYNLFTRATNFPIGAAAQ